MEIIGNGLITLANGAWDAITSLISPLVLGGVLLAAAMLWFAIIEVDNLNRQGNKPEIGRH